MLLRLSHFGNDASVFIEDKKMTGFMHLNPFLTQKYYNVYKDSTLLNFDYFKKQKDSRTFRVFVMGESTVKGYPYNSNGSVSRILKYRLSREFPEMHFDIINCALTNINSYAVLDITKEVVKKSPDAVILYLGHNEYNTMPGVASANKLGSNHFIVNSYIYLKKFRSFQALSSLWTVVSHKLKKNPDEHYLNFSQSVFSRKVFYKSNLYNEGKKQFAENLDHILKILRDHNVPVFIGNLVSNEKDQAPFLSETKTDHGNDGWYRLYMEALRQQKTGDNDKSLELLKKVNSSDSSYALAQYNEGLIAWKLKDFNLSKRCFKNAKELDLQRFRAPDEFNRIIKEKAVKYKAQLVDIKNDFEKASPNEIIGKELISDHIHPDFSGYFLMAGSFYNAIQNSGLIKSRFNPMENTKLRDNYPLTEIDSLKGIYEIYMLKEGWPFFEKVPDSLSRDNSYISQIAGGLAVNMFSWKQVMDMLFDYYRKEKNMKGMLKITEAFTLEYPFEEKYFEEADRLSIALGDIDRVVFYQRKLFDFNPAYESAHKLFLNCLKADRPEEAIPYLDFAIAHNKSGFKLGSFRSIVIKVASLEKMLGADSLNKNLMLQIAREYYTLGNTAGMNKYVNKISKIDPSFSASEFLKQPN